MTELAIGTRVRLDSSFLQGPIYQAHASCLFEITEIRLSLGQRIYSLKCLTCPNQHGRDVTYTGVWGGHLLRHVQSYPSPRTGRRIYMGDA